LKTYIITLPDCSGQFARHDFEAEQWESTDDLAETWTVDAKTSAAAVKTFRETFEVDRTHLIGAVLLSDETDGEGAED
jgi:hypothetical protein